MTPDTELNAVQAPPGGSADPARASADGSLASPAPFLVTKEHRRFAEFADAVRRDRYIGLCYGAPGVGKTLSARHYAGWDAVEPYLRTFRFMESGPAPEQALASRSLVYTPTVANTPRTVDKGVTLYHSRLSWGIGLTLYPSEDLDALTGIGEANGPFAELLIVDEADRLKTPALEHLRDHHDRTGIGLILIGMPGIEKRLARYPQLYSRVGFVHHYRPLSAQEQAFVLARHWPELGLGDTSDFTTSEAVAAITRITSGNFRLTCRLVAQIQRVLDINHLSVVTKEVVEAARESLVIGIM
jgi:DNA transposition AAA+ family ATPase